MAIKRDTTYCCLSRLVLVCIVCVSTSSAGQQLPRLATVVREAFLETHKGWSSDEVIANDVLNEKFIAACRRQRDEASEFDLNWTLLSLRKAGKLGGTVTRRSNQRHDEYRVAAEIAARLVQDRFQVNTDRMLCHPQHRSAFDETAMKLAPQVSAYQLRKAALGLRKARRLRPELVGRVIDGRQEIRVVNWSQLQRQPELIPNGPGVYIFRDRSAYLYIGESGKLRQRLQSHVDATNSRSLGNTLKEQGFQLSNIEIEVHIFDPESQATEASYRRAYESELISTRHPRFNVRP